VQWQPYLVQPSAHGRRGVRQQGPPGSIEKHRQMLSLQVSHEAARSRHWEVQGEHADQARSPRTSPADVRIARVAGAAAAAAAAVAAGVAAGVVAGVTRIVAGPIARRAAGGPARAVARSVAGGAPRTGAGCGAGALLAEYRALLLLRRRGGEAGDVQIFQLQPELPHGSLQSVGVKGAGFSRDRRKRPTGESVRPLIHISAADGMPRPAQRAREGGDRPTQDNRSSRACQGTWMRIGCARHKGQGCGTGAQDFPPAENVPGPASHAADLLGRG
jgi:hypothetical protein